MKQAGDTTTPDFFGLGASTAPPPPAPAAHITDYRALGDNFRQREQVARKVQRWAGKFRELTAIEQAAIMEALQAIAGPDDGGRRDLDDWQVRQAKEHAQEFALIYWQHQIDALPPEEKRGDKNIFGLEAAHWRRQGIRL